VKQRIELEARERRLRALLQDEEAAQSSCLTSDQATGEPRLGEFVPGSLKDGHDWSLEALKEHAYGIGLKTSQASGRALNITLVTLLRQGLGDAIAGWQVAPTRSERAIGSELGSKLQTEQA
jgi:hypothetical protein